MKRAHACIAGGLLLAGALLACSGRPGGADKTAVGTSPRPAPSTTVGSDSAPINVDTTTPLPSPLPMVAARVNGRNIPTSDVVIIAERSLVAKAVKDKVFAYRQAMNQLVIRELMLDEAVARGLSADDKTVEQAYNEARVQYKDDEAWRGMLKQQGFTPESYRNEMRSKHTITLLLGQEARKAGEPSEVQVQEFYTRNLERLNTDKLRAAHILIRATEDASPEQKATARARAEEIRGRLKKGEDFGALAKQYSADPSNAAKGGVLDVFGRGQMDPQFEAAAYALEPGQISDVVRTAYGYHVIKLLERVPGPPVDFEKAKDQLRQQLAQQMRQQHLQAFVNGLWRKSKVEMFL